ncbi:hypothetical protein, partial [Candidatus Kuenenia stuttgartiensis]|uniref:hypothetical protein n=1 Tax=Kuenenia stuttgartiensis TaxID=174633 RepID=UPI001E39387F
RLLYRMKLHSLLIGINLFNKRNRSTKEKRTGKYFMGWAKGANMQRCISSLFNPSMSIAAMVFQYMLECVVSAPFEFPVEPDVII